MLVLASASPRRRELLSLLGVEFEVRPVDVDEDAGASADPLIVARKLARITAEAARLADEECTIIAADTVVHFEGDLLAKPADAADARRMLERLRGNTHLVVTAVALMLPGRLSALIRHPLTQITMRDYTEAEIAASIERGDPFDKAGGYAIQDAAMSPVARYEGCYCNVVGLPLWSLLELMRKAGMPLDVAPEQLLPQCAACPLGPR